MDADAWNEYKKLAFWERLGWSVLALQFLWICSSSFCTFEHSGHSRKQVTAMLLAAGWGVEGVLAASCKSPMQAIPRFILQSLALAKLWMAFHCKHALWNFSAAMQSWNMVDGCVPF